MASRAACEGLLSNAIRELLLEEYTAHCVVFMHEDDF